ncbi:MAG: SIP domain-containing protein [Actinomycetota bacterium]|nr:SIP domain-containing protein [Actinomycetota bacterium]
MSQYPGRAGVHIDPDATAFLLAADETAIPAICQLFEHIPSVPIVVHLSVSHLEAIVDLHRDVDVTRHLAPNRAQSLESLCDTIRGSDLQTDTRIRAAGETAAMQRIRSYLFQEIDFPRSQTSVRGYWKRDIR